MHNYANFVLDTASASISCTSVLPRTSSNLSIGSTSDSLSTNATEISMDVEGNQLPKKTVKVSSIDGHSPPISTANSYQSLNHEMSQSSP